MNNKKITFDGLVILGAKTVIAYLVVLVFLFAVPIYKDAKVILQNSTDRIYTTRVVIAEQSIPVGIADTDEKRVKGLSGTESLKSNEGMLFVFDRPDNYSIWMKDMNYSLDIIWLNESKEIIYIEENISPKTYPKLFVPSEKALYVLEVNAGFVENSGIKVGDQATIL